MFTKIKEKIFANKSSILKIAIFLGIYFLFSEFAFAEEQTTGALATAEKIKSNLIEFFSWGATLAGTFLGLMTYLATLFLSPEWTSGSFFNMSSYFKDIWIFVSNTVYFVFAFIIIVIAFANILGVGGSFELKQALPKFIVGILIVPFSWFIVNFVVSLSSVLTIGAMNLPMEIFKNYETKLKAVKVYEQCSINLSALGKSEGKNGKAGEGAKDNSVYECQGETSLSEVLKTDKSSDGIFGIMSIYTYGILNIESLNNIKLKDAENVKTLGDVLTKILFDLIFVIIYALLMIALGLALMIRGIRLWIYIMLSPLFGLMYFFGKSNQGGSFFEKFNFKEFITLALVPVYTMLALSFGLLFIWITGEGLSSGQKDGGNVKVDGNVLNIGNFKLEIKGAAGSLQDIPGFLSNVGNGALGIIGILILKIFGIVILWVTIMAALKSSSITKTIIEPIAKFGEGIGNAVSSLPQYVPILPGQQSLKSLEQVPGLIQSKFSSDASKKAADFAKNMGFMDEGIQAIQDLKDSINKFNNTNKNTESAKELFGKIISIAQQNKNWYSDRSLSDKINEGLRAIGGKEFEKITVGNNSDLAVALNNIKDSGKYSRNIKTEYSGHNLEHFQQLLGVSGSVNPPKTPSEENKKGNNQTNENAQNIANATSQTRLKNPKTGQNSDGNSDSEGTGETNQNSSGDSSESNS